MNQFDPAVSPSRKRRIGLTLIEVLVILALVFILTAVLLPALMPPRAGSNPANCMSNLRQVGLAWLVWVPDHESQQLPFRTSVAGGGTFGSTAPLRNNAWWQYSIISNELASPQSLVCPADRKFGVSRRVASDWSSSDAGGFLNPAFRDRATSYTIGLDITFVASSAESAPLCILGTDRNILFDSLSGTCSSGLSANGAIRVKGSSGQNSAASAPWTNAIHGLQGNVLLSDGSVHAASWKELDQACDDSGDDNGSIHFLVPK